MEMGKTIERAQKSRQSRIGALRSTLGTHFAGMGMAYAAPLSDEVYYDFKERNVRLSNCPTNKNELEKKSVELSSEVTTWKLSAEESTVYKETGLLPVR
jgi:hypothetical protein